MKKLITFTVIFVLIIFMQEAFPQLNQQWFNRYNGPTNLEDKPVMMRVDNSGNVYVTGFSDDIDSLYGWCTIKYNSAGVQQWIKRYHNTNGFSDIPRAMTLDNSGNIYVTGHTYINSDQRCYTIKYSPAGAVLWSAAYYGTAVYTEGNAIIADNSGNVYVAGSGWILLKYNSAGVQQWERNFSMGGTNEFANAMAFDNTGNIIVAGENNYNFDTHLSVLKYSPAGDTIWVTRDTASVTNSMRFISIDASNNIYVGGSSGYGNSVDYAVWKFNSAGARQWINMYDGGYGDEVYDMTMDRNGYVSVTGNSYDSSGMYANMLTIRYSPSGGRLWTRRYNSLGGYGNCIFADSLKNIYVGGFSGSPVNAMTIVKYDSSGTQKWFKNFTQAEPDIAKDIFAENSGNIIITGPGPGNNSDYDYVTIKYSQTIGIKKINSEIPSEFSLSQNYPNPFNPSTMIKFSIPKAANVKLTVYDITGKEISVLVNEEIKAGSYEFGFIGSNLPSGIYFYKLTAEDFNKTRKMILVK